MFPSTSLRISNHNLVRYIFYSFLSLSLFWFWDSLWLVCFMLSQSSLKLFSFKHFFCSDQVFIILFSRSHSMLSFLVYFLILVIEFFISNWVLFYFLVSCPCLHYSSSSLPLSLLCWSSVNLLKTELIKTKNCPFLIIVFKA